MSVRRPAGVLLAAGQSSRLGQPKAALRVGGKPALLRLIDVYTRAGLAPLLVVAQGEAAALAAERPAARLVMGDPHAQMIDSLARALALVPPVSGVVVQPVDAPFTTENMIHRLLEGAAGEAAVLAHGGAPGHPVFVPASLFRRVSQRPEGGLRTVLAEQGPRKIEWQDRRVLADLDGPDDLAAWEAELARA